MTQLAPEAILLTFLLFCRIGGCLMLMPGFSSTRIPVQIRLFIAVAVSLVLAPLLLPVVENAAPDLSSPKVLTLIISELMLGALIGLLARAFFAALQFMATAAAMYSGYSSMMVQAVEDNEPIPAFATLVTLTATLLFFLTDQHWEVFRGLVASYTALPVTQLFAIEFSLTKLTDVLSSAFVLALQISAPFIVFSLIVNLMVGIANKLTPQIPVYFIALPFVLFGGLLVLYFTVGEFLRIFSAGFARWLALG